MTADGGRLGRAVRAQGLEALVESRIAHEAAILPASGLRGTIDAMHVEVRKVKDVVIVDLSGKLLAGVGDEILRDVVNELLAEGWKKILLNLSEVTSIDSAGVGELVASLKVCERFGAKLKLLNLHERVRKSLHLSQLLPVFEVYDERARCPPTLRGEEGPLIRGPLAEATVPSRAPDSSFSASRSSRRARRRRALSRGPGSCSSASRRASRTPSTSRTRTTGAAGSSSSSSAGSSGSSRTARSFRRPSSTSRRA